MQAAVASAAAQFLPGCDGRRRRPDIVLVSIDTLRPDRLGCYGNFRPTSPCIDALARDGVLFRNAFSTAPWTLPAHLSLFASREPGRYFQSVGSAGSTGDKSSYPIIYSLQDNAPTIASELRGAGYDTVGFHGALLTDSIWGLDHGFREYRFSGTDDQFDLAVRYVRERRPHDRPFFLFVHSYVVHRPYTHEAVFGHPAQRPAELTSMDFVEDKLAGHEVTPVDPAAPLYGWQPGPRAVEYFKTVYDGGVHEADRLLQRLVSTLQQSGLYDDAAIVVTSDHGEEFWEHVPECSPDHNHSLFDELLRIPLVVKLPGGALAGREVHSLARIHDIGPTLYDVAAVPIHAGATGRSLLPAASGTIEESPVLYAGCTYMGPTRHAIRTDGFKYIRCPAPRSFRPHFPVPAEALYDLATDPGEQNNIFRERPDVADELRAKLSEQRAADLPISLTLDDPQTRAFMPAMGLEAHARRLIAEGRATAELPMMNAASDELLDSLRALGYL